MFRKFRIAAAVFAGAALFSLTACSDAPGAQDALEAQGFKNIKITGYSFFGCDENDTYHTGFQATGPTGLRVEGVVCAGMFFKGATVRITGRVR